MYDRCPWIFKIKFLEIYPNNTYLHNFERYSSGNSEIKLLCKMSKSTLYPLQSLTIYSLLKYNLA